MPARATYTVIVTVATHDFAVAHVSKVRVTVDPVWDGRPLTRREMDAAAVNTACQIAHATFPPALDGGGEPDTGMPTDALLTDFPTGDPTP